jgi:hypothetical protein
MTNTERTLEKVLAIYDCTAEQLVDVAVVAVPGLADVIASYSGPVPVPEVIAVILWNEVICK